MQIPQEKPGLMHLQPQSFHTTPEFLSHVTTWITESEGNDISLSPNCFQRQRKRENQVVISA